MLHDDKILLLFIIYPIRCYRASDLCHMPNSQHCHPNPESHHLPYFFFRHFGKEVIANRTKLSTENPRVRHQQNRSCLVTLWCDMYQVRVQQRELGLERKQEAGSRKQEALDLDAGHKHVRARQRVPSNISNGWILWRVNVLCSGVLSCHHLTGDHWAKQSWTMKPVENLQDSWRKTLERRIEAHAVEQDRSIYEDKRSTG